MKENEISYGIRGTIFKVYNALGPGLLESAYEAALEHELKKSGFDVKRQKECPMVYEGIKLDTAFRIDLLVNDLVIIEIKAVESLHNVHHKQLLTYLKLTGLQLGILVNFNTDDLQKSIVRKVNRLHEQ